MLTKKTLRAAYIERLKSAGLSWVNDLAKWANFEKTFDEMLAGGNGLAIGPMLIAAWNDLGGKGKPTYKALHALPEE